MVINLDNGKYGRRVRKRWIWPYILQIHHGILVMLLLPILPVGGRNKIMGYNSVLM